MTATPALTTDLKREVLTLEDDLRARLESITETDEQGKTPKDLWQEAHHDALTRGRTSASWVAWRDDRITQAAVGWVLTTVFVRFSEDNTLVTPVWITGPGPRRQEALDAELAFYRERSANGEDVTTREWLQQAVAHLNSLPSTAALVDSHAALHLITPSGDAAEKLVAFWRQRDGAGAPRHDLMDPTLSTRFLGDLYQDLSDHATKTFALLQTPFFVEEFILDRTLEPALDERSLEGFCMIDPTCGSGHFLLGAFDRLLDRWQREAPGLEKQAMVQEALDAVHGVDLNPFAVAIARFRLTVAALQACGLTSLQDAPAFQFHVATGDSLLHGPGQQTLAHDADLSSYSYRTEDLLALQVILSNGRYDAVVGNPPYIAVRDRVLSSAYRERYRTCKGKYALSVPFMERFFGLARTSGDGHPPGRVGQITSNSFMKREFGSRLVEDFLANKDLLLVADTSGCHIPGHSTPTVVIVGRNQQANSSPVRAALARPGESAKLFKADGGPAWQSLVEHIDEPGYKDEWFEITDFPKETLARHPWSLGGGGAQEVKQRIDAAGVGHVLGLVRRVGFFGITGADEMFLALPKDWQRLGISASAERRHVAGEEVRDWSVRSSEIVFFPYDKSGEILSVDSLSAGRYLWPARALLSARRTFAGTTYAQAGRPWWGWHQLPQDTDTSTLTLAYANVATHGHFAASDSAYAFNSKAVVLKFDRGVIREDVVGLAAILNSSSALFWLRSVALPKPLVGEEWQRRYEFDATKVGTVPLPLTLPKTLGQRLASLAEQLAEHSPGAIFVQRVPTAEMLAAAQAAWSRIQAQMVSLQEELDWEVYGLYGLVDEVLTYAGMDPPGLALGERAFEIALARQMAADEVETAWFTQHGSTPIEDLPPEWTQEYTALVQRRIHLIANDPTLRLLEKPEYKRRWAGESWVRMQEHALRSWLLGQLEARRLWFDAQGRPTPRSVAQLADDVARVPDLVTVLALWEGRPDVPLTQSLARLLADEAVPYLAAHRYKDSGLRKREEWERTWALQRHEDAGEKLTHPGPRQSRISACQQECDGPVGAAGVMS